MRYIKTAVVALFGVITLASCMDDDWKTLETTTSPYGNNSLTETNVVTIAELRSMYKTETTTSYAYKQVTEPMQIKAVVTGNDIEGNIYKEISVQDETGAIIIAVNQGGMFGYLPVGTEILVELNGLYVGNYGKQAEIGTLYTNSYGNTYVSRMERTRWQDHFKITGQKKTIEPEVFADGTTLTTWSLDDDCGKLGIIKNVTIKNATATTTFSNPTGTSSVSVYFNEQPSSVFLYTSPYADFAATVVPQGKCNITGIFKRYSTSNKDSWEIIIRSIDDVEEVE